MNRHPLSPYPVADESRPWPPLESNEDLRIYAPTEIIHVLKGVMEKASIITAYFDRGSKFALTSILGISPDANEIYLEPGPDEQVNQMWLAAADMLLVTNHQRVKIKFVAHNIEETSFYGLRAFRLALPYFLIRLQRREYFRIATSLTNPIMCRFPSADGKKHSQAVVLDISVGGVALLDNHHELEFEPGAEFEDCRIELPGLGVVRTGLVVQNIADVNLRSGLVARRAGCRFVKLSRAAENLVQRFIMSLELKSEMRLKK